jgi:hypothetical protein
MLGASISSSRVFALVGARTSTRTVAQPTRGWRLFAQTRGQTSRPDNGDGEVGSEWRHQRPGCRACAGVPSQRRQPRAPTCVDASESVWAGHISSRPLRARLALAATGRRRRQMSKRAYACVWVCGSDSTGGGVPITRFSPAPNGRLIGRPGERMRPSRPNNGAATCRALRRVSSGSTRGGRVAWRSTSWGRGGGGGGGGGGRDVMQSVARRQRGR